MARRDCTKVVLVPGIMGTELRLQEADSSRVLQHSLIWGEDLNVIWKSLAEQPNVFSSEKVKPGRVLRYLSGYPLSSFQKFRKKFPVYGPLFEYLSDKHNFREGDDLLEFGYDWRACNVKSSRALAEFLQKRTEEADRVTLIAHSMGALICRAFLADATFAHLHARIHRVIQLGAPVLGSPAAFFTLKNYPRIHALFDVVLKKRQKRNPELYRFLLNSLGTFQSLFQLLPPATEQIVFDESGVQYSALNQALWAKGEEQLLKGAEALHNLLELGQAVRPLFDRDSDGTGVFNRLKEDGERNIEASGVGRRDGYDCQRICCYNCE
jgi:pimeloyl-ACP methyl ester carboxylesterase